MLNSLYNGGVFMSSNPVARARTHAGTSQGARKIVPLLSAPDDVDALSLAAIADRLGALREEIKRLEDIEATYVESAKKRLPQGKTLVGRMFTMLVSVTKRVIIDTEVVKTLLTPRDLLKATKEIEITTVLAKRR